LTGETNRQQSGCFVRQWFIPLLPPVCSQHIGGVILSVLFGIFNPTRFLLLNIIILNEPAVAIRIYISTYLEKSIEYADIQELRT
jgi:hypothetical protein